MRDDLVQKARDLGVVEAEELTEEELKTIIGYIEGQQMMQDPNFSKQLTEFVEEAITQALVEAEDYEENKSSVIKH